MKKSTVWLLLVLFLFSSCENKDRSSSIQTIDATPDKVIANGSVFAQADLIRLETTDSCLLENIVKADLGEDIYVLSSYGGKLYKFDKHGHYLWQLRQGQGPGELVFATDFHVDAATGQVYVLDNYRDLKIYSSEGEYLKTESLPSLAFLFTRIDNATLCFDPNLKKKADFHLYVSQEGEIKHEGLRKKESNRKVGYMPSNVFAKAAEQVYIQHMLSDTVYAYSPADGLVTPAFYIQTHGLSVNSQELTFPDSRSFYETCKERDLIPGVSGLAYLTGKIYLTLSHHGKPLFVTYDVAQKRSAVYASLCEGFPASTHCVARNENSLVYCYSMDELLVYREQGNTVHAGLATLLETASAEDNPILVVFREKDTKK